MSEENSVMDWRREAEAVIKDVGFALRHMTISSQLPESETEIYLNVETREGRKLCIELSSYGFRVVSDQFDLVKDYYEDEAYYETPFALFDKYSRQFRECFAAALEKKLSLLTT